jgi:phosphate transport system substrate-binding protein
MRLELIKQSTAICILVLLLTACGGKKESGISPDGSLHGEISLSGAFALYPLAVQWADEFQNLHPDVKVDVSAGGAGKGITDALAQVVDLGMVSRELGQGEIDKGAVGFAVAKDAVVPTINVANPVLKDLLKRGLTKEDVVHLWIKQDVSTWGGLIGTTDKTPIVVYNRSDACGAAETWAAWFDKKQEDLQGTAVFGDPGVATAVQKDANGIGYNNIGYAYDAKTGKPNPGILVVPVDVNGNGQIDPEEDFYETKDKVVKAIADGLYPSPPARDLYLVSKGVPTDPVVRAFLRFILTEGQKYNIPLGYIDMNQEKVNKGLKLLGD